MIVTITGPSGSGKTSLLRLLCRWFPDRVHAMVSSTTRPPRQNEEHGIDYFFVPPEAFDNKELMIEQVEFGGNLYGLTKDIIEKAYNDSAIWIAVVDVEGSLWLKEHYGAIRAYMKISRGSSKFRLESRDGEEAAKIRHQIDINKGLYDFEGYDILIRCNQKKLRKIAKQFIEQMAPYTSEENCLFWIENESTTPT